MKRILRGLGVYPALSIGKIVILKRNSFEKLINKVLEKEVTVDRFKNAVRKTKKELENLIKSFVEEKEELSKILEFQLMLLQDDSFIGKIYELINEGSRQSFIILP